MREKSKILLVSACSRHQQLAILERGKGELNEEKPKIHYDKPSTYESNYILHINAFPAFVFKGIISLASYF